MKTYAIHDNDGKVIAEFDTLTECLDALMEMDDDEVKPFSNGCEGYYTDEHYAERGLRSVVYHGKSTLRFKDGAPIESISSDKMGMIIAANPCDEQVELMETLDFEKADAFFDSCVPKPIVWNPEERTMTVDFYCLETKDNTDCDVALYYKCQPFNVQFLKS